ncbi:MAG: hypothetical protein BWY64_01766 [bacterium ADurb.Bin363]|nr:MAG: hypothetical protein BWY64_01766 [bacterium ADurb.Bin363]
MKNKAKAYYNNALNADKHCERAREGLKSPGIY